MNDTYKIPGTDTYQNKLGLTDPQQLEIFERKFSSARQFALERTPTPGDLDFQHLKDLHKELFRDVYEWAGEVRTVEIAKGTQFAPTQHIDSFADKTFKALKKDNHLQGLDRDQFTTKAAHYLGEINAIHPFRDGNGRAQRLFMSQVAGRAGFAFDWSQINEAEMRDASIDSFHSMTPTKMKALLEKTLVEPLKDKGRQEKLESLAANDPDAYEHINDIRTTVLALSEQNISSQASRERFSNAVTDQLLEHYDRAQSISDLKQPDLPTLDQGKEGHGIREKGQGRDRPER